MRKATAELILKDPGKYAHHDRVFLNNPVVMQGMGLAPLVVLATSGQNAVMLAAAVALLLVPSRVLACLLSRLVPLNSEHPAPEELQKKLLPRALVYSLSAAVVYLAAYPILNAAFGTSLLALGIYLPLLVVEPLLIYRFGRVQETVRKAVSKGLRITVGYALLLMLLGCVREWLALGTVFGTDLLTMGVYLPMLVVEPLLTYRFGRVQESMHKAVSKGLRITLGYALLLLILGCVREWLAFGTVFGVELSRSILPMASMPAGGFIVLGVVCAVWRALARRQREYLKNEARGYLAVHPQSQESGKEEKE